MDVVNCVWNCVGKKMRSVFLPRLLSYSVFNFRLMRRVAQKNIDWKNGRIKATPELAFFDTSVWKKNLT